MDSPANPSSTRRSLLQAFGLSVDYFPGKRNSILDAAGQRLAAGRPGARVQGGRPILFSESQNAVMAMERCGKGKVIVMADSEMFSSLFYGSVNTVPDAGLLRWYRTEYWMLQQRYGDEAYGNGPPPAAPVAR